MKRCIVFLLWVFVCLATNAQKKPATEKVVEGAEKINKKAQQINEASDNVVQQAEQIGSNVKNVADNVKKIIKVFEPIFRMHFRKGNKKNNEQEGEVVKTGQVKSETNNSKSLPPPPEIENTGNSSPPNTAPANFDPGVPESEEYNSDGTANWGNQYNAEFGCFLDVLTGTIADGGTAEDKPGSIDLIYLAPNDGQNAYYLITPNFAHDNISADAFWGSATTDNPVKSWRSVNESEVALTTISGSQFDKIQYNEQLRGIVKGAKGFASFFMSINKLDGKVFAVKTTMGERDAFALIYVVKHVGTSGSGGYLKVKIKCTGFDKNGDGTPDVDMYGPR